MRERYAEIDSKLLPMLPDSQECLSRIKETIPKAGNIASYIIGKIRIKMTQGIFIEDVLFDAYNPKTKIPLKILVNKFMISGRASKSRCGS